ncbi:hypothetical protein D3C84_849480 [compost metagenome]
MQTLHADLNADNHDPDEQEQRHQSTDNQTGTRVCADQGNGENGECRSDTQHHKGQDHRPRQVTQAADSPFDTERFECGERRQAFTDASPRRSVRGNRVDEDRLSVGGKVFVSVGKAQLYGRFAFDPCINAGFRQCLKIGLRLDLRQILLERDSLAREQPFDCSNIAFVQGGEILFGGGEVNAGQQSTVE